MRDLVALVNNPELSSGVDVHMEACYVCKEGGDLVCCDGCTAAFHLGCASLESVPEVGGGPSRHACLAWLALQEARCATAWQQSEASPARGSAGSASLPGAHPRCCCRSAWLRTRVQASELMSGWLHLQGDWFCSICHSEGRTARPLPPVQTKPKASGRSRQKLSSLAHDSGSDDAAPSRPKSNNPTSPTGGRGLLACPAAAAA